MEEGLAVVGSGKGLLKKTVWTDFETTDLFIFFSKVLILVSRFDLSDFKSPFDCFKVCD